MAARITSIDNLDRLQQRPAGDAIDEARQCLSELRSSMEDLAATYPGIVALAGIGGGETHSILVAAPCAEGTCYSVGRVTALRELALVIANLTAESNRQPSDPGPNLRVVFEAAWQKEKKRREKEDARLAGNKVP
jgi:hypothetical protein